MNSYLISAAVLTFIMGLTHSILGEKYFLVRLFQRELPHQFGQERFVNRTTRIAWHLTTVAWWNSAAILVVLALREMDLTAVIVSRIISNIFLVSGIVSLIGSRGRHLSWVVFWMISLLAWLGTY